MEDTKIRVVIADCHEIVREGIAMRISSECNAEVVGQAADGYNTIKLCRALNPDVLLMDLGLERPSGTDTFAKLRSLMPEMKIIVLSSEATTSEAFAILGMGAVGFMPKQAKGADFVNCLRTVSKGYTCVPSEYMQGFVDLRRNVSRTGNIFGLSPREVEVLEACKSGAKTKEIASKLNISVRTVETHRNSIYKKTATRSVDEFVAVSGQI
ncbi:response regulator transcription factor [Yoonia sp.]|jgi:DNA-binding NarL/FixJ family response regulator|uniref:response regulator n=1 Tax=Yoonia sp. TaxID=2212373 RepID=UPI0025F53312|nr:response regulator transcription factor [Yoonia sp.]